MHTLLMTCLLILQAVSFQSSTCPIHPETRQEGYLFSSVDRGTTWRDIGKGLPEQVNPMSFWAEGGTYFLGTSNGVYIGSPMVPITKWEKALLQEKDIRGIYAGQHGPYAVSQWHGFYEYQKGSGLWKAMTTTLKDQSVNTLMENQNGKLYAGCESGLYVSADHGKTWTMLLEKGGVNEILVTDQIMVVCTNHNAWKSTDGGTNWSRISTGTQAPFKVLSTKSGLAAICPGAEIGGMRTPNTVFLSENNGATWNPIPYDLPSGVQDVNDILQSGNDLFASGREGIYRSTDEGKTWTRVFENNSEKGGFYKMTVSAGELFILYIEGC